MKGASAIRSPMKRTLICIVLAAVTCLAAVWAAPRTSASVAEWLQAPPGARRQTARRLTAASTLDAGMRFTMAGVICGAPPAAGAGSPAALENVRLVAIDPSEDGDIEEVSLRLD